MKSLIILATGLALTSSYNPPPPITHELQELLRFDLKDRASFSHHGLSEVQWETLEEMAALLAVWNERINVVSRRDCPENLIRRHYLPSLAMLNLFTPPLLEKETTRSVGCKTLAGASLLDVGTGGGFPGLPLAVACPHAHFTLVDTRKKKLLVVRELVKTFNLNNVEVVHGRVQDLPRNARPYDFLLGRAVTALPQFISWVHPFFEEPRRSSSSSTVPSNGIVSDSTSSPWGPSRGLLYIKSGDTIDTDLSRLSIDPDQVRSTTIAELLGK